MKCEICNKSESSLILKAIVNGKIRELYSCRECARKYGYSDDTPHKKATIGDYIRMVLKDIVERKKVLKCNNCNKRYIEFVKDQMLGCPFCYLAFRDVLLKVIEFNDGKIIPPNYTKAIDEVFPEIDRIKRISELKKRVKTYLEFEDTDMARKAIDEIKRYGNSKKDKNI